MQRTLVSLCPKIASIARKSSSQAMRGHQHVRPIEGRVERPRCPDPGSADSGASSSLAPGFKLRHRKCP
jgi:hypothetical protein